MSKHRAIGLVIGVVQIGTAVAASFADAGDVPPNPRAAEGVPERVIPMRLRLPVPPEVRAELADPLGRDLFAAADGLEVYADAVVPSKYVVWANAYPSAMLGDNGKGLKFKARSIEGRAQQVGDAEHMRSFTLHLETDAGAAKVDFVVWVTVPLPLADHVGKTVPVTGRVAWGDVYPAEPVKWPLRSDAKH